MVKVEVPSMIEDDRRGNAAERKRSEPSARVTKKATNRMTPQR